MKRILQPHGYLQGRTARKDDRGNLTVEGVDTHKRSVNHGDHEWPRPGQMP